MANDNQLSFADGLLSNRRKISQLSQHLDKLDQIIDWPPLSTSDRRDRQNGCQNRWLPPYKPLMDDKATFLQSLFSLSDPQLEDQLMDCLSFQRFVGIQLHQQIPNFTTFWRF